MPGKPEGLLDQELFKPSTPQSPRTRARGIWMNIIRASRPTFLGLKSSASTTPRKTAYLDGIRGFAAFLVYILHHELWAHSAIKMEDSQGDVILELAWGYEKRYHFVTLPFVRNFFVGGHIAVACFFVISGYVLSAKPLSLIHSGDFVKLGDNVASAIFRRWFRLFLPIVGTTFVWLNFLHITGLTGLHDKDPNYGGELWNWYTGFKNFSFVWNTGGGLPWFSFNNHTWTIPLELKGSLVVYMSCLSFARFKRDARLMCQLVLMAYFMLIVDGYFASYFMAGMFLCDLDLLAEHGNLPEFFHKFKEFEETIFHCLFIIAMYLAGVPSQGLDVKTLAEAPGWYLLSLLKPQAALDQKWFYLFPAAVFFIAAVPRMPWLKWFFDGSFCQYLGRISYGLYLVHGPVLWVLGRRLYTAVGLVRVGIDDKETPAWCNIIPIPQVGLFGLELNFLACHIILLPLTLWIAEVVTKAIDEPSVRFAQWLHRKMLPPTTSNGQPRGVKP